MGYGWCVPAVEDQLRLIVETIGDVVWMISSDKQRCLYISAGYEQVWGRSCQSMYEGGRSFLEAVHPEDREHVIGSLELPQWEHEYRIIRPDGALRWVWGRGTRVLDAAGEVDYYVGISTDITERALAQHERQLVVERLELVARSTNDGFWDWDMVTGAAWWSDSFYAMLGIDRGRPPSYELWASHIHPDDEARVLDGFSSSLARGDRSWSDEYRFVRSSDGVVRVSLDRAFIIYDDNRKPIRMGGVQMDLTERRELEAQLRHSQRMDAMGQLAGGIAHDFNNMLQAMMIDLQLMQQVRGMPAKATELAGHALQAVERAAALTRQLLLFTRREAMEPRRIELDPAVTEIARMLERLIGEHVQLDLRLAASERYISVDPGMLDQVVMNLAINARDAMPNGGTLTISTAVATHPARHGQHVCIVVTDTGAGIPREVMPRIFEPFFSTKDRGQGTGLGLAVVYGIVEQHRGWIDVDSDIGVGATFRVFLPLDTRSTATIVESRANPVTRGSETILIVEDDPDVRRSVRLLLEDEGYCVHDARHAAQALEIWDREHGSIDLVLTDLVMPGGIDGCQLAAELERRRPALKLVFSTGYRRDITLAPHQVLLQKPVSAAVLLDAIRGSLDRV